MIKLRVTSASNTHNSPADGLKVLYTQSNLLIEASDCLYKWENGLGEQFFILGHVIGIRNAVASLSPGSMIVAEKKVLENPEKVGNIEGRFVIVKVLSNGECEVWTDQFGRVDIYWQKTQDGVILASGMDLLPVSFKGSPLDTIGVTHALTVYGSRPAKEHTLYKDVQRLGVFQRIQLLNGNIELKKRAFTPASTNPLFVEKDMHRYSDYFIEAIRAMGSNDGNVVYLSSGWDSTSILAVLVHIFGNRKVRAVIGRMRYSDRSGVINQFEIDRAKAVADYFKVKLDIIELDYRLNGNAIFDRLKGLFRSQQFANMTGVNHWLLAEETAKTANADEVIFAGEMSDGAHNLGFSQFVTIFHPASLEFREYSDKMASYLYGPTFLTQLQKGVHEADPIWQLFKQRAANTKFEQLAKSDLTIAKQLLSSFFLRGGRMPLYSIENSTLLSPSGAKNYVTESEKVYLDQISQQVNQDTLYACYLHLYNSFHWQGSTVTTLEHTAGMHGLKCVLPFHDSEVINFLSAMPESWGRGLDLNPTKYPLKWMLKNRIDYPWHLQVGPHSYTYDVDPGFSLVGELLHASSLKDIFSQSLNNRIFISKLDPEAFNMSYIENIVARYLNGEELFGQEMNDIYVLAIQSTIGIYAG
jgi:hypothetical protein